MLKALGCVSMALVFGAVASDDASAQRQLKN
jgi:hypothetical protein